MNLYFVRHGKDEDNYRGGWSERGLTEEGTKEAEALGVYLLESNYKIDILISSDLRRAKQTTEKVEKFLDLEAVYSEEWRENNNGVLAGMLNSEANEKYPGLFFRV
ncbi:MAG: histidine phosphatase family protein [Clostridium sp.]